VPRDYQPHRFTVKIDYCGASFGTVTVEVAIEEVGGLEQPESVASHEADDWFAELGLAQPEPVPVLPLAHQIAQKLHACTAPDADGNINERAHDLVDLQLAYDVYDGELRHIREVAVRLFASRNGHLWPPTVTARDGWEQRYDRETDRVGGLDVVADLAAAMTWANKLVRRIDEAA